MTFLDQLEPAGRETVVAFLTNTLREPQALSAESALAWAELAKRATTLRGYDIASFYAPVDFEVLVQSPHHETFLVFVSGWRASKPRSRTLLQLIDDICTDPTNLEDNEQPPSEKAISDLKKLIIDASVLRGKDIMLGDVAPYFGEVSVTWRNGNNMLRATSFPDARLPRLDFGTTPDGTLGEYDFLADATGALLSQRLSILFPEETTPQHMRW
jgi:hypothetical protein